MHTFGWVIHHRLQQFPSSIREQLTDSRTIFKVDNVWIFFTIFPLSGTLEVRCLGLLCRW
jgi:hypothetical protein